MNTRWRQVTLAMIMSLAKLTIAVADDLDLSWYTVDSGGDTWTIGAGLELSGTVG